MTRAPEDGTGLSKASRALGSQAGHQWQDLTGAGAVPLTLVVTQSLCHRSGSHAPAHVTAPVDAQRRGALTAVTRRLYAVGAAD